MSFRTARRVMGILAAAVLTLSLAPTAVAGVSGRAMAVSRPLCATQLAAPSTPGGSARIVRTKCFGRLDSALRFAAAGAVIPDGIAAAQVDQATIAAPKPSPKDVTTIIGIHWEHAGRQGRDRIYFVKGADPCAGGRVWQISKLDRGWDSIASSAEGFGGCGTFVQFARPKFKGGSRACTPYCDSLGALNDRVGSIRWRA
jgi:hypothetical protein